MEKNIGIEEISKDMNTLSIEVGVSKGRGNIIIIRVNSPYFRNEILNFLSKRFTYETIGVNEGEGNEIIKKLRQKETKKDALIWIMPENMSTDIENALNNYRELFYEYPAPSIIFCNELFLQGIIMKAPDFWRYRGNFYIFKEPKRDAMPLAFESLPISISFKDKKDLMRRKRINEHLLRIAKDEKQKVGLLLENSEIYLIFGNFKKMIEVCEKALESVKEIGDKSGESECYTSLGIAYRNLGHFSKAIEYYEKSLKMIQKWGINQENLQVI